MFFFAVNYVLLLIAYRLGVKVESRHYRRGGNNASFNNEYYTVCYNDIIFICELCVTRKGCNNRWVFTYKKLWAKIVSNTKVPRSLHIYISMCYFKKHFTLLLIRSGKSSLQKSNFEIRMFQFRNSACCAEQAQRALTTSVGH